MADGEKGFLDFLKVLPAGGTNALPERTSVTPPPLEVATEAPPGQAEELAVSTGLEGEEAPEAVAPSFFSRKPPKEKKEPKGPKAPITAIGTAAPGLPPEQAALLAIGQRAQRDAIRAQGLAQLQAGQASVEAQRDFEQIAVDDANAMFQLVETEFPKFRAAQDQLNKDIDDARQMKVNPYNFMQSVGRAGRVTSAISVAVGQLAAGAGNPNSAQKMIKAAIERDIDAQKANIDLAFRGIEAKSGLIGEEVDLLERQFLFGNQARAVAWTAVQAQMGAAKQEAANESQRIAIEMLETNALVEALIAKGQADAELIQFKMNAPVRNVTQALARKRQIEEIQQAIQPAAQPLGAPAGAPPTAAPPTAEAEPVAAPVSTAARTRAGQAAARRREEPVTVSEQEAGSVPEGNVVPEPIQDRPTGVVAPTSAPEVPAQNIIPSDQEIETELSAFVPEEVLQQGSFAKSRVPLAPSLVEGIKAVGNNWIMENGNRFPGFASVEDAQAAAFVIDKFFRPVREQYENDVQFRTALAQHNYTVNNPELLEAYTTERFGTDATQRNESNNIRVGADGRRIRLSRDSDARIDPALRQQLKTDVTDTYQLVQDLRIQSEAIRENGIGSFLGFRFTGKGIAFTPFNPEVSAEAAAIQSRFLDLGIGYMKRVDPSGRLTNEDIQIGKAYWNTLAEGGAKAWDVIQETINPVLGKDFSETAIRQGITRFLQSMSLAFSDRTMRAIGGEFIIPWEEQQRQVQQVRETQRWMDSQKAE